MAEDEEQETQEETQEEQQTGKKGKGLLIISSVLMLIIGMAVGAFVLPITGLIALPDGGDAGLMGEAELQQKIEVYLNDNFFEVQGMEAKITGLEDFSDNLYTVYFDVYQGGQKLQPGTIYATKDGAEIVAGSVFNMAEPIEQPDVPDQPDQPQPTDVPKSDKPEVELFIMSYCPFGLQMQKATLPVMELLGDKADIEVKFVYYIMHGLKEIEENNRQYCIQKEQAEKAIDYMKCFTESDDYEACLASAEIDTAKLDACIAAADEEFGITAAYEDEASWLSGRFPLYNVHKELNDQYGVRGSPTMVIIGTVVSVTRSPEAIKQAICDAFNTAPEECSQELSTQASSSGFGGGTGSATDASCG
jgi:hypothetical protein